MIHGRRWRKQAGTGRNLCTNFFNWGRKIGKNDLASCPSDDKRNVMILDEDCLRKPLGALSPFLEHITFLNKVRADEEEQKLQANPKGTRKSKATQEEDEIADANPKDAPKSNATKSTRKRRLR